MLPCIIQIVHDHNYCYFLKRTNNSLCLCHKWNFVLSLLVGLNGLYLFVPNDVICSGWWKMDEESCINVDNATFQTECDRIDSSGLHFGQRFVAILPLFCCIFDTYWKYRGYIEPHKPGFGSRSGLIQLFWLESDLGLKTS